MNQITCLKCKEPIDAAYEQCPQCGERVTSFQRTYATRLIDGKYQILDRLGIGGMGEIFKVRHIHLNELRVIKIMRPNVAQDDQGLQRFLQEARTSTMIKHKNLAMLYDFAQLDDGSYYMVWEFIDGTNIQKWIGKNGAMPPRLAIEIAIQALNGLDHLHSMGLIHRDISPENIMLSQDHHGKLLVKVIDFGIAKSLAEGDTGQHLTQTGMFLGKLKYASPEQAGFLKEGEHLDPRSDLYSFGIVMYEMLAGRAPFLATNPNGYILKHVTEKPAPIVSINPDAKVPPQLEAIIMKSLEKSRDHRFATAADFAEALEGIRNSVAPDAKYGLGDKMITLSGAQTLADLPKITTGASGTFSGAAPTQQTQSVQPPPSTQRFGPTGTRAADEEATRIERTANDAPTVMERMVTQAASTQLEPKVLTAEPTQIERQMTMPPPEKRFNATTIGAIAGAIAIVIGLYFMFRKPAAQPAQPTAPVASTAVTTTAPAPANIPAGEGALLLSASPWGDIDKIVNDGNKQPVALSDDNRSTPARLDLAPGKYLVTMSGPSGKTTTFDVQVDAGRTTAKSVDLGGVNFDELEKEVSKP
ncbi:MAG TPA: serine/threonine-protein kinase [Thermoanaerobaculia bacterium]|nr:serine/threonine-protein kinase [Thermoanaerobaculia bacterium]